MNDRANACYEDGSMAGKCDTDWEWNCGWYMIRFDYGILSREEVPGFCASLLPALPGEEASAPHVYPTTDCILGAIYPSNDEYYDFNGGNYISAGTTNTVFSDSACATPPLGTLLYNLIYAPNGSGDALDICRMNGGTSVGKFVYAQPYIYVCT